MKHPRHWRRPRLGELGPWGYSLARWRKITQRRLSDWLRPSVRLAGRSDEAPLPVKVRAHSSLIMRRLGNVEMSLQEGKRTTLSLVAPLVDGVVIHPGETFSFWRLVGEPTAERGFGTGVTITNHRAVAGVGGGLCQLSNLLHWMVLHSPLDVVEHHHHNGLDLFPDFQRQIPFGTGTSVAWNYVDYRVRNNTDQDFQLLVSVDDEYLRGELRTSRPLPLAYHVREQDAYFYEALDDKGDVTVRRHNVVVRRVVDKRTGNLLREERLLENDGLVCYDRALVKEPIRPLRQTLTVPREGARTGAKDRLAG